VVSVQYLDNQILCSETWTVKTGLGLWLWLELGLVMTVQFMTVQN